MLNVMVGYYYNVSIMFPDISLLYPIVIVSIMGLLSHCQSASLVFTPPGGEEFCLKTNL